MLFSTSSLIAFLSLTSAAMAHSNMFSPTPRANHNYPFQKSGANACENTDTNIPSENKFQRGQSIPVKWWWNNHKGGFIKMAIVPGVKGTIDNAEFLKDENIIQGQCYYFGCDDKAKDPGNTKPCIGKNMEIPSFLADGDYVLQWSQIGGFHSDGIPTKQLPLYHTCANIKISGGAALTTRPSSFKAPFFGGDQFTIGGKASPSDQCAFKVFDTEPTNPADQDPSKGVNTNDIKFGPPGSWAKGGTSPAPKAPAPSAPATPASGGSQSKGSVKTYTVKAGDDCSTIAKQNGVSLSQIMKNNPKIKADCKNLEIGQKITLRRRSRIMV